MVFFLWLLLCLWILCGMIGLWLDHFSELKYLHIIHGEDVARNNEWKLRYNHNEAKGFIIAAIILGPLIIKVVKEMYGKEYFTWFYHIPKSKKTQK